MRRLTLLLALVAAVPLCAAGTAAAKPRVGIGDQSPAMFADARYQALHTHITRLVLQWDWYKTAWSRDWLEQWVTAARSAHARPMIAFSRNWRPSGEHVLPTRHGYLKGFRKIRRKYPWIRDFTAWNEANHGGQPTHDHIRKAAVYYKLLHRACGRKCTIVAADVLDSSDMPRWVARFQRFAPHARLWGLHAYKDANDGTTWHTKALLHQVRGQVWLTETGGIKRLKPYPGSSGKGRRTSLRGQARAIKRVYKLSRMSRRIRRIYFYQWIQEPDQRWDSALVTAKGRARPALRAVRRGLHRYGRR